MVGYRPGLPCLKHQKRVMNPSNVVARAHTEILLVHQGKLALHCTVHLEWQLLAIVTMLEHSYPPKRHRTLTFISFFQMSSILKVQNVLLHRNVWSTMLYRCYLQNTIAHYHLNGFFFTNWVPCGLYKTYGTFSTANKK